MDCRSLFDILADDDPTPARGPVSPAYLTNSRLFKAAAAASGFDFDKEAIVPAGAGGGDPSMGGGMPPGGAPPADPSGGMPPGGAPPADPSAGGAAPPAGPDPATVQAVVQAVMAQLGQAGGGAPGMAGGAMGKGGKKAEQAITDAKLFAIDMKLSLICEQMGIQLPATATLGAPPDPMASQAASQDHQNATAVASNPDSSAPAPPPVGQVQPMDAATGPIGKAASFGDPYPIRSPALEAVARGDSSPASRFRAAMGG